MRCQITPTYYVSALQLSSYLVVYDVGAIIVIPVCITTCRVYLTDRIAPVLLGVCESEMRYISRLPTSTRCTADRRICWLSTFSGYIVDRVHRRFEERCETRQNRSQWKVRCDHRILEKASDRFTRESTIVTSRKTEHVEVASSNLYLVTQESVHDKNV